MGGIQAGDEVRVYDVNGKRVGQPEGGWRGKVVKVGRTLAHIHYGDPHWTRTETFTLEDGQRNDRYGRQWFLTMDEAARRERLYVALSVLGGHGITLDHGNSLTLEQIEALAEVARTFSPEEG